MKPAVGFTLPTAGDDLRPTLGVALRVSDASACTLVPGRRAPAGSSDGQQHIQTSDGGCGYAEVTGHSSKSARPASAQRVRRWSPTVIELDAAAERGSNVSSRFASAARRRSPSSRPHRLITAAIPPARPRRRPNEEQISSRPDAATRARSSLAAITSARRRVDRLIPVSAAIRPRAAPHRNSLRRYTSICAPSQSHGIDSSYRRRRVGIRRR